MDKGIAIRNAKVFIYNNLRSEWPEVEIFKPKYIRGDEMLSFETRISELPGSTILTGMRFTYDQLMCYFSYNLPSTCAIIEKNRILSNVCDLLYQRRDSGYGFKEKEIHMVDDISGILEATAYTTYDELEMSFDSCMLYTAYFHSDILRDAVHKSDTLRINIRPQSMPSD